MKDPHSWERTKDAFASLVELTPAERATRLAAIGETDPDLRRSLELLLEGDAWADVRLGRFDWITPGTAPAPSASDAVVWAGASSDNLAQDPFGLVGHTVSSFHVLDVIGRGGMGVVYRAEDSRLGRTVALKLLLPQLSMDAIARERFRREARSASSLDHPNICTVYEVGESDQGYLFLAMACYRGPSLADRLDAEGALPVDVVISIARDILRGLAAAHAAGIVHRDLKPGNLMAAADGTTKILDFGLARVRDFTVSDAGFLPGTLAYMSPEQLAGAAVDERSDLWSLGIVLYEALTGSHPFGGGRNLSTLYSVLHEAPPPIASLRADVPPHVAAIVDRLLRCEPDERFASAAEVLATLEENEPAGAGTDPGRGRGAHAGQLPAMRTEVGAASRRPRRRAAEIAAAIVIATLAILVGGRLSGAGERVEFPRWAGGAGLPSLFSTAPEARSVAVLSFVDTSGDRDQEYFSDGFSEELLNTLAQIPELRVPARTSSFYFKGRNLPVQEVARQLGVSTVLEGSVQRAGDRVRVTARLIDARADRSIWARTFDRDLHDLYAIQSEIAELVAGAFQIEQAAPGGRIATQSFAAHENYLRGLFHWNRRSPNDLRLAIDSFEEAIRLDPDYAHPHGGIALAYVVQFHDVIDKRGGEELLALVEAAAERALALDPSLAQAHAARAYAYSWRWRWTEAELEFQTAIGLSPAYSTAHQWYGEHLAKAGRGSEAVEFVQHALALDPLSLVATNNLGLVLFLNGDFPAAIEQLEKSLAMDGGFTPPLLLLHRTHLAAGDVEKAVEAARRWAELSRAVDPVEIVNIVQAIGDPALKDTAVALLEDWEQHDRPRLFDIMVYYAYLGEMDRAVRLLESGISERLPMLGPARVHPLLAPIRTDPRARRALATMEIL